MFSVPAHNRAKTERITTHSIQKDLCEHWLYRRRHVLRVDLLPAATTTSHPADMRKASDTRSGERWQQPPHRLFHGTAWTLTTRTYVLPTSGRAPRFRAGALNS